MSGGRGIVRIVNGPVSCTVDIDRPLTADEMRALAPLARAAADIAAVFTGASGDRSEPSRSSGCEARSTTTSPEAAMSDTKRAADSKSQCRGLESDGANPSDTADPCPHCDDGTVWEDGFVGSCCEVCGGTGLRSDNGGQQ